MSWRTNNESVVILQPREDIWICQGGSVFVSWKTEDVDDTQLDILLLGEDLEIQVARVPSRLGSIIVDSTLVPVGTYELRIRDTIEKTTQRGRAIEVVENVDLGTPFPPRPLCDEDGRPPGCFSEQELEELLMNEDRSFCDCNRTFPRCSNARSWCMPEISSDGDLLTDCMLEFTESGSICVCDP